MSDKKFSKEDIAKKYNIPAEGELRENISISQVLFRQILNCEQALSTEESGFNFNSCVDGLFHLLPAVVKADVTKRSKEYVESKENWIYQFNCGQRVGSPNHVVRYPDGKPYSPIKGEAVNEVNYRSLFNIVMDEIERHNLSWKTDSSTVELGKLDVTEAPIPQQTLDQADLYLKQLLDQDQLTGSQYSMYDLVKRLLPETPPTPDLVEDVPEGETPVNITGDEPETDGKQPG